MHLASLEHDEADYVMDTFRIVGDRDSKAYGETYDAIRKAIDSSVAFQTPLTHRRVKDLYIRSR
jgi:hypothetical protein